MAAEGNVDRIVHDAFFRNRSMGIVIEVGAARPDYLSIGAHFRELGWKVLAVEPNPEFCAAHRARGHDVLEYACSDEESDEVDFYVVDSKGANYRGGAVSFESFSSLGIKDRFVDLYETVKGSTSIRKIPVKVRKLDTILAAHAPGIGEIDILAIDVEGWELNVLRGFSLDKHRPKVVVLENVFKDGRYTSYMRAHGYGLWRSVEPNEIYVRMAGILQRTRLLGSILLDRSRGYWPRLLRRHKPET